MDPADFNKLKPGRILHAAVSDMKGRGLKDRPVVVLTAPLDNNEDATFEVACGSRTEPEPNNEHLAVQAQGMDRPGGHPRTGLTATTWFYAMWLRTIQVGDVRRLAKFVPDSDFAKLRKMIEDTASAPDPPSE